MLKLSTKKKKKDEEEEEGIPKEQKNHHLNICLCMFVQHGVSIGISFDLSQFSSLLYFCLFSFLVRSLSLWCASSFFIILPLTQFFLLFFFCVFSSLSFISHYNCPPDILWEIFFCFRLLANHNLRSFRFGHEYSVCVSFSSSSPYCMIIRWERWAG